MRFRLVCGLTLVLALTVQLRAQTSLAIGDISISGFNSNNPDDFVFVLWRDVAANTRIKFTDNAFLSSSSATASNNGRGGENFVTWTAPVGGITAGSIIRLADSGGGTTSVTGGGTAVQLLGGLNVSGDQIFAYQGVGTGTNTLNSDWGSNGNPTTFTGTVLFGVNWDGPGTNGSTGWLVSGTVDANTSYLPSELNVTNGNLTFATTNSGRDYSGVRTGLTLPLYRAAVNNGVNFTGFDLNTALSTTNFTATAAASITWDSNGTTAGTGGNGTWDTTTDSRFSNGGNDTFFRWVNSDANNAHTAVFGGTAGVVSIAAGGVTASGLTFNTDAYTIQNNTINMLGSIFAVNVPTGSHTATVNSILAGSGGTTLSKSGLGSLVLGGLNTYTGLTSISQGTLKLMNTGSLSGSINVDAGANFDVTSFGSGFTLASGRTLSGKGTVSGKTIIQGTVSPGNSIGSLSVGNQDWATGGQYTWEVNSLPAAGTAGTNWDLLNVGGTLDVPAGAGEFTIKLVSVDGGGANPGTTLTGLSSPQQYTWTIASATTITNFNQNKFSFNTSQFSADQTGIWSVQQSGNNVVLVYATPEPTAIGLIAIPLLFIRRRRA